MSFYEPESLEELWGVLEHHGPRVFVAGGTDLMVGLRDGPEVDAAAMISLIRLREAAGIYMVDGVLQIGALCTHEEIRRSTLVAAHAACLCDAAGAMASPPIRNRGTIGGNVATSSPAGDLIPPLFAMDASIVASSRQGERAIPVAEFFRGVKRNALERDEIVLRIEMPASGRASAFRKIGPRRAMAVSKVSVAFGARMERRLMRDVRVALGAVAPTAIRSAAAERALEGREPAPGALREASLAASDDARPIDDFRSTAQYRRAVIPALLEDAIAAASARWTALGRLT